MQLGDLKHRRGKSDRTIVISSRPGFDVGCGRTASGGDGSGQGFFRLWVLFPASGLTDFCVLTSGAHGGEV